MFRPGGSIPAQPIASLLRKRLDKLSAARQVGGQEPGEEKESSGRLGSDSDQAALASVPSTLLGELPLAHTTWTEVAVAAASEAPTPAGGCIALLPFVRCSRFCRADVSSKFVGAIAAAAASNRGGLTVSWPPRRWPTVVGSLPNPRLSL